MAGRAAATILPGTKMNGYHLIDARLEWNQVFGTEISLAAFAKNLTDEKYKSAGSR